MARSSLKVVAPVTTVAAPVVAAVAAKMAKPVALKSTGLSFDLPLSSVKVEAGYNVRDFDAKADQDDAWLLADIKAHGIRTPIDVRKDGATFYVVAGHRRFAALSALVADGANIATVPAMVIRDMDVAQRTADLIRSNTGKPLSPAQRGVVCLRLKASGMSDDAIGEAISVTGRAVRDMMRLAKADPALLAYIKAGDIKSTLALDVVKAEGDNAPAVVAEAIKIAKGKGKSTATAPDVAAALATKGTSGKVVVGSLAKAEVAVAKALKSSVTTVVGPVAKPSSVKAATPDTGAVARVFGPFVARGDEVFDRDSNSLCTAESPAIARAIAAMMTAAYARQPAKAN